MIARQSLLLGVATVALAGAGHAQTRGQSRDDLQMHLRFAAP